jgi:hypothetical protein
MTVLDNRSRRNSNLQVVIPGFWDVMTCRVVNFTDVVGDLSHDDLMYPDKVNMTLQNVRKYLPFDTA